jgi:hypothetical protein
MLSKGLQSGPHFETETEIRANLAFAVVESSFRKTAGAGKRIALIC